MGKYEDMRRLREARYEAALRRSGNAGDHRGAGSAGPVKSPRREGVPKAKVQVGGSAVAAPSSSSGRGRPAGPHTVPVPVRLSPGLVERLDAEAGRLGLTRSETIRALIERGL